MQQTDASYDSSLEEYLLSIKNNVDRYVNFVDQKVEQMLTTYDSLQDTVRSKILNFIKNDETIKRNTYLRKNMISSSTCYETFKKYYNFFELVIKRIESCARSKIRSDLQHFKKTLESVDSVRENFQNLKLEVLFLSENGFSYGQKSQYDKMLGVFDNNDMDSLTAKFEYAMSQLEEVRKFVNNLNLDVACSVESFKPFMPADLMTKVKNCKK